MEKLKGYFKARERLFNGALRRRACTVPEQNEGKRAEK